MAPGIQAPWRNWLYEIFTEPFFVLWGRADLAAAARANMYYVKWNNEVGGERHRAHTSQIPLS